VWDLSEIPSIPGFPKGSDPGHFPGDFAVPNSFTKLRPYPDPIFQYVSWLNSQYFSMFDE
jgi:hypothetical protein